MKEYKKHKVIMLSIKDTSKEIKEYPSPIALYDDELFHKHSCMYTLEKAIFQHLYILSDDKIKVGDWITDTNKVYEAPEIDAFIGFKKIIASTDISLELPQIPQSFINTYIEEYNNDNIIDEVNVEYIYYNEEGSVRINMGNTINISLIKDSYSREEVILLINKFLSDNIKTPILKDNFDKWIEQNIKKIKL